MKKVDSGVGEDKEEDGVGKAGRWMARRAAREPLAGGRRGRRRGGGGRGREEDEHEEDGAAGVRMKSCVQ